MTDLLISVDPLERDSLGLSVVDMPAGVTGDLIGAFVDVIVAGSEMTGRARVQSMTYSSTGRRLLLAVDWDTLNGAGTSWPERLRGLGEDLRVRARQHAPATVLAFYAAVGIEHVIAAHTGSLDACARCVRVVHERTLQQQADADTQWDAASRRVTGGPASVSGT